MNKNILITGGGGYVGSYLVPILLKQDFNITVYDRFYFNANYLPNHKNLKIINGDIRDIKKLEKSLAKIDCVIHLACISNDASFELDKDLSKSTNLDCFEPLVKISKKESFKDNIYFCVFKFLNKKFFIYFISYEIIFFKFTSLFLILLFS